MDFYIIPTKSDLNQLWKLMSQQSLDILFESTMETSQPSEFSILFLVQFYSNLFQHIMQVLKIIITSDHHVPILGILQQCESLQKVPNPQAVHQVLYFSKCLYCLNISLSYRKKSAGTWPANIRICSNQKVFSYQINHQILFFYSFEFVMLAFDFNLRSIPKLMIFKANTNQFYLSCDKIKS